jgi:hypothetical protein
MFGQVVSMTSFAQTINPESIKDEVIRGFLTACVSLSQSSSRTIFCTSELIALIDGNMP